MNQSIAKSFVEKYSRQEATEQDKTVFLAWLTDRPDNELETLLDEYNTLLMKQPVESSFDKTWLDNLRLRLDAYTEEEKERKAAPVRRMPAIVLFRYAAALIIVLGACIALWIHRNTHQGVAPGQAIMANIVPGGNRAVLTLADGTTMVLDSAINGHLASQGTTTIMKLNTGLLSYNNNSGKSPDQNLLYNTISTPRGGQYQIILPDGSKVWLNAASSIRFPTSFKGMERKVEIKGEAYFDVAHDKDQPFKVESRGQVIEVLGTGFNISAYLDEKQTRTTLVEGKIKVGRPSDKASETILSPGQQVQLTDKSIQVLNDADIEEITAWKDGYFKFGGSLESIMDKVARWYDVEVVYENNFGGKLKFLGKISRTKELSTILDIIASSGKVHFNVEGRRVTVTR